MPHSATLAELIDATPWIDVHEHIVEERHRLARGQHSFTDGIGGAHRIPEGWPALIVNYTIDDLVVAGLPAAGAQDVLFGDGDPLEAWRTVEPYFQASRATGFVRTVDLTTERLFGARLSAETVEDIDRRFRELRSPGYYGHILRDVANIERCQIHSLEVDPFCDSQSPELFDQDLAIVPLALGRHPAAEAMAGIDVATLDDYLQVIEHCFGRYGSRAVAVKCHWAYLRPLAAGEVDAPPRRSFLRMRRGDATPQERREVEDFLFHRCVELAAEHGLPVKVHMGYLARTRTPQAPWIHDHVTDMAHVVQRHPRADFVLMHMAWPQQEQLLGVAKHFPNVYPDLAWSWIVAPHVAREFVARCLTTIPANKLLCFGGDCLVVESVVGHAEIARRGLQGALEDLVASGWLTTDEALALVPRLMRDNAEQLFYDGTPVAAAA
jgi:predicted TIM-barrel fold metal-dependent hydrolase